MKVEQLMIRNPRTCRPGDSLGSAVQQMLDADCGCLPIVSEDDPQRLVGILTDRDICMATHRRGRAPQEIEVREAMSTDVRTVGPSEDLLDASAIMRDAQVRRLPVVDADRRLLGLVSLADLARAARRRGSTSSEPEITEEEIGETLSLTCIPTAPSAIMLSA